MNSTVKPTINIECLKISIPPDYPHINECDSFSLRLNSDKKFFPETVSHVNTNNTTPPNKKRKFNQVE